MIVLVGGPSHGLQMSLSEPMPATLTVHAKGADGGLHPFTYHKSLYARAVIKDDEEHLRIWLVYVHEEPDLDYVGAIKGAGLRPWGERYRKYKPGEL